MCEHATHGLTEHGVDIQEAALKTQVFGPIEQWLVRHKEFSVRPMPQTLSSTSVLPAPCYLKRPHADVFTAAPHAADQAEEAEQLSP